MKGFPLDVRVLGGPCLCRYEKIGKFVRIILNKMATAEKKRADEYDSKLAINGSFEEVIEVMVTPGRPAPAPKPIKPKKKK
jgi:hypothetical protein